MSILSRQLIVKLNIFSFIKTNLYSSNVHALYEGDSKTTITILNKNFDYGLMINNITEHGFILNNGIRTIGPMIVFSKLMLSWNIASSTDMNKNSFSLVLNLEPKLDLLVIGLDDNYLYNEQFILDIKKIFRNHKILVEILPVYHACSTFNFLNSENRYVAAALIPPKSKFVEDLLLQDKVKCGTLEQDHQLEKIPRTYSDEILSNPDFDGLNTKTLIRNKEIKQYFKVRRPWKVKNNAQQSYPLNDSNKK
ncbi:NADH dehydrogenase [ubiquinone] 1 alpha subcomplex assembly factor 3 isoform X2 [Phymastichus coffea]|uniref:NADH dehydrogenase [ubiquinone] 1 alpha subcomplex assembly factor 3 isoform X2 n=1 Tax=Phymastichus coffea TaxID=108790 RepID=UPI00273B3BC6|nr:NADH dehydrogenase [ubiquinone] 1 alpha subcomplex assembly factor 3 isoform X2 [Phymastichus coffea]